MFTAYHEQARTILEDFGILPFFHVVRHLYPLARSDYIDDHDCREIDQLRCGQYEQMEFPPHWSTHNFDGIAILPDKASSSRSDDTTANDLGASEASQWYHLYDEYGFEESDNDVSIHSDTSIRLNKRGKYQDRNEHIPDDHPIVGFGWYKSHHRPYGLRTKVSGFLVWPRSDTPFHLGAWRDCDTEVTEASCCINQDLSLKDLQPLSDESIDKFKRTMTIMKVKPLESGPDPGVRDLKSYLKFRILGIGRCMPHEVSW